MKITGQIPYLRVADMARSLAFYVDGLGFEVVNSSYDETGVFWASLRKDAAAVMIGSVLEEHLRQLCHSHKVDIFTLKGMDEMPKKADVLNADLKKSGAYGPLDQKQVTAWLGLRNSAAHGKYS